jgi:O-antigen/teichoic acid export membrane protein
MIGMSITATILLQTDKVILSNAVSLEAFGFYSIAWIVAQAPVNALSNPVYSAVFPRLTQYVTTEAWNSLRILYHLSCQVVSVLVLPTSMVIILFGQEVLTAWLGQGAAADAIYPLLVPLGVAMTITGLLVMPFALQLAHGWTTLAVSTNVVSVVVFIPLVLGLARAYGARGGGIAWILLTSANLLLVIGIMHRFILKGEARQWLTHDVVLPLVGAALPAILAKLLLPDLHGRFTLVVMLGGIWAFSALVALAVTPGPRRWAIARYKRLRQGPA